MYHIYEIQYDWIVCSVGACFCIHAGYVDFKQPSILYIGVSSHQGCLFALYSIEPVGQHGGIPENNDVIMLL